MSLRVAVDVVAIGVYSHGFLTVKQRWHQSSSEVPDSTSRSVRASVKAIEAPEFASPVMKWFTRQLQARKCGEMGVFRSKTPEVDHI